MIHKDADGNAHCPSPGNGLYWDTGGRMHTHTHTYSTRHTQRKSPREKKREGEREKRRERDGVQFHEHSSD